MKTSKLRCGLKVGIVAILVVVVAVLALRIMFPLPDITGRAAETARLVSAETMLGRHALRAKVDHSGQTGVAPLVGGKEALTSRLALIEQAQDSIDAQYYIWHDDMSGILLLDALDRAARRGVRVRLLLDDNGIHGLDPYLAALNAHPNFIIRIFNPSTIRSPKLLGYAIDFPRMNRRMHNKSLIVDGAAAIIGGRNIGDEYFEIGDYFFRDLDVLATGAIVPETATAFDAYWNSMSVYPIQAIVEGPGDRAGFDNRVQGVKDSAGAMALIDGLQSDAPQLVEKIRSMEWTRVRLVVDDPIKGTGKARGDQLMISRLIELVGGIDKRLDLVSAYFIPGTSGAAYFADLAQSGVQVNVLTNAMDTTDVFLVHAGYTKYRRELLDAGVTLFELKLHGASSEQNLQTNPLGISGAALHAKTFGIDGESIFIGSFNFDPRSAMLNSEMGFLIDSPTMAGMLSKLFDGGLAKNSYRPELSADGRMVWQETLTNGKTVTWQQEPDTSWLKQVTLAIVGILPVEWLL